MKTYLPGTTIEADLRKTGEAKNILDGLFAGGGIMLSQLTKIAGVEAYCVQNWVKRGFCTPPKDKKYDKAQLCRLLTLQMLKDSMALQEIVSLLSYINGDLLREDDDLISDDRLYLDLVEVISAGSGFYDPERVAEAAELVASRFEEPTPGSRERLRRTLEIMACAYYSSLLHRRSDEMMRSISLVG